MAWDRTQDRDLSTCQAVVLLTDGTGERCERPAVTKTGTSPRCMPCRVRDLAAIRRSYSEAA